MSHQKKKRKRNSRPRDRPARGLKREKHNLLKIVAEKDEKIQTLKYELDITVDQNRRQIQNLEESVSKNTDLEQDINNLLNIVADKDQKIKTLEDDHENT